jgi:hypothetical protein
VPNDVALMDTVNEAITNYGVTADHRAGKLDEEGLTQGRGVGIKLFFIQELLILLT